MIDISVVITGIVGLITTIVSGWTSWFFTRKKYNTEVDSGIIKNMKDSLEFYKTLSNDNKARLEEVLKRNEALENEVSELRNQMFTLMGSICVDLQCQLRKRDLNLFNNETKSSEES